MSEPKNIIEEHETLKGEHDALVDLLEEAHNNLDEVKNRNNELQESKRCNNQKS